MYHTSDTTDDEYNKRGNEPLMRAASTAKSDKLLSRERKEKQNKPFIVVAEAYHNNHMQEKEGIFLKSQFQKIHDAFELKINTQSTEPVKPLPASAEPSHYSEFATKLGYLMEKVTEFAKSSGNVSVKSSEGTEYHNVLKNKSLNTIKSTIPKYHKKYLGSDNIINDKVSESLNGNRRFGDSFSNHKDVSHVGINYARKVADTNSIYQNRNNIQNMDPQYLTYRMLNKYDSITEQMVPPILNNNIKYIRVSSQDFTKGEYNVELLTNELEPIQSEKQAFKNGSIRHLKKDTSKFGGSFSCDTVSENLKLNSYANNTRTGIEKETFRFFISGHLTTGETPLFIVHKNYTGSSTLIKNSLDFKARKKEGNVDILLTGKFFRDNILIENDKGCPFALDLKSHEVLIDSKSTVTQEKFRHIFHLGLFDAVLEGEFVENCNTLQYIPIFSLEVVKHKPSVKINFDESTTLSNTNENTLIDSSRDEIKERKTDKQENAGMLHSSQEHKHVRYLIDTHENNIYNALKSVKPKKINKKLKESKLKKLKESTFFKLFFRHNRNYRNGLKNIKSNQNITGTNENEKKEKEEEVIIMRSQINKKDKLSRKDKETKREGNEKPKQNIMLDISEVNSRNDSCSSPKKVNAGERTQDFKDKVMENKNLKKKQSKRRKIVENPGVSQMQGFFFQT